MGEVKTPGMAYQGQVAATLLFYLGLDYRALGADVLPALEPVPLQTSQAQGN